MNEIRNLPPHRFNLVQRGDTNLDIPTNWESDTVCYVVDSDGRVLPFQFDKDSARIWCEESNASRRTVDLMGGATSRYGDDVVNFDLRATDGIADSVESFGEHFPPNSVPKIIADNPRATFLPYVSESLESGGTIVVRGNRSNKFVGEILDGTAEGIDGFVASSARVIDNPGTFLRTDGSPVRGTIWEIILRKK